MSYAIDGFNITLTRGDALSVRLPLSLDGNEYVLQQGDVVRFAINTADHEDTPILVKELDGYVLTLDPEDTKNLDFGTYLYDVEITFAETGKPLTYIPDNPNGKAKLKLTCEAD